VQNPLFLHGRAINWPGKTSVPRIDGRAQLGEFTSIDARIVRAPAAHH